MKLWEYCRDLQNNLFDGLSAVGGKKYRTFDWKGFAEKGDCLGLSCEFCPFYGRCRYKKRFTDSDKVKLLNEEAYLSVKLEVKEMKEVTEWDNNPREMWVWDDNVDDARKMFVVYIRPKTDNVERPVLVCLNSMGGIPIFKHCAEIGSESQKKRLMTNKELARWLATKPDREFKTNDSALISHGFSYYSDEADDEIGDDVCVREGDGPWFVPFAEGD